MALPVYVTFLANLRGPQGVKGDPGTFESATAETVPAGQPAEAIISGPNGEDIHFKVPQGLPGVNAVANDTATATYISAPASATRGAFTTAVGELVPDEVADAGSATRTELDALYPVHLVWDGSAYPARVAGAVNIFFGPVDPGLLMEAGDYWANEDTTTLAEVAAATLDESTDLFEAVQVATIGEAIDIPMTPRFGDAVNAKNIGAAGMEAYGWEMPDGAVTGITGTVNIPYGWNVARIRLYYYVPTGSGSGDVRVSRAGATYRSGSAPTAVAEVSNTIVAPVAGSTNSALITGDINLAGMERVAMSVKRNGTAGADTFSGVVFFMGARLEKVS